MAYYRGTRGREQAYRLQAVSSKLWYCITVLVFSTAHERKTLRSFSSTTVQFRLLRYPSERAIISDITHPEQATAANVQVLGDSLPRKDNTCYGSKEG